MLINDNYNFVTALKTDLKMAIIILCQIPNTIPSKYKPLYNDGIIIYRDDKIFLITQKFPRLMNSFKNDRFKVLK